MQKKIVILGGKGKEGQRWAKLLAVHGEIIIVDKGEDATSVADADIVVIALPSRSICEVADTLGLIKQGALCISVMGIMSISRLFKDGINAFRMLIGRGVEIAFVHCMCASHMSLEGQNVIFADQDCGEIERKWIQALLIGQGAKVTVSSGERHDHVVKFTQKFMREIAIMFACSAVHEGVTLEEMLPFSTPPSRAFLAMVCRVLLQPKDLNEQIVLDLEIARGGLEAFTSMHLGDGLRGRPDKFSTLFDQAVGFVQGDTAKGLAGLLS